MITILNVEVGQMSLKEVHCFLNHLKEKLIEEDPGHRYILVPTRNGVGRVTQGQEDDHIMIIGGDDTSSLFYSDILSRVQEEIHKNSLLYLK